MASFYTEGFNLIGSKSPIFSVCNACVNSGPSSSEVCICSFSSKGPCLADCLLIPSAAYLFPGREAPEQRCESDISYYTHQYLIDSLSCKPSSFGDVYLCDQHVAGRNNTRAQLTPSHTPGSGKKPRGSPKVKVNCLLGAFS